MGKIYYQKISLFDAPKDSFIAHACNAQGVWGSGIAKEFKKRFPKSFEEYNHHCKYHDEVMNTHPTLVCTKENDHNVICLITSDSYASEVDPVWKIVQNTQKALDELANMRPIPAMIYSNKFNSGLFNVPWEQTEKLIQEFIDKFNIDWTIADPSMDDVAVE